MNLRPPGMSRLDRVHAFAVFRRNAGSEPVFGRGRAFRRNTVTSLRKPDACRVLATCSRSEDFENGTSLQSSNT